MSSMDKALETQLRNIQTRTGKSLDELYALMRKCGLTKHGQIRDMLKTELSMGHGDANTLVTLYLRAANESSGGASEGGDALDAIYTKGKEPLRPIHEKLMKEIEKFGPFEVAPKKAYVSLRRKKQFATIGPATKTRVEVGLNMKGVEPTPRLLAIPPGGMCQYEVNLTDAGQVDKELIAWIRTAYDTAG